MEYDKNLKRSVGKRVHDFRVQHDYTQAQFAEFMDISVNFLSEIENGKKGMSQETLYRLCQQFHLSSDYILFGITLEDAAKKPDTIIDIANHLSAEELTQVIEYLNSLKKMKMMKLSEFVNKKLHAIFHRASKQFKVDACDLACGYGCTFPPLYPLPDAAVGMTTLFPSPVPSSRRRCGYDDAFPSPVPSISCRHGHGSNFSSSVPSSRRRCGYDDAFPSPVPSSRRRCGYDDAFPSPVPSFQRHRGYDDAFFSPVPYSWSSPHPHKQFDPPITGRVILHLYFFLVDRAAASGAASAAATASTAALPSSQLAELAPHDKEDGDRNYRNNNDVCHICLLSLLM